MSPFGSNSSNGGDGTFPSSGAGLRDGSVLAYFRCPLRFGQSVLHTIFPVDILDRPLPASNRELALTLDRTLSKYLAKLQRNDIVSRTKTAISDYLPSGSLTDTMVADALQMGPQHPAAQADC